jgi:hypothetical protein
LDLSDDLAVSDYAAGVLGPPKRLFVRLALDPSGERLIFEEGNAVRNEIEALGFRLGTAP